MPDRSDGTKSVLSVREKIALGITCAIGIILGGVGLAQETTQPTITAREASRPVIATRQPAVFRPLTQREPVISKRAAPPTAVDWKAVRERRAATDKSARARPSTIARLPRNELNRTRLPVLVPRDGGVVKTQQARMVSLGDAYSLNLPQDKEQDITVYGTRSLVEGERGSVSNKSFSRVQSVKEDVQITRMEDGWSATFSRFGVVYTVDFLCTDDQPECQNDTRIKQIVADMDDVALGEQAEAEADAAINPPGNPAARWLNKAVGTVSGTVRNVAGGR